MPPPKSRIDSVYLFIFGYENLNRGGEMVQELRTCSAIPEYPNLFLS